ncbi:MAG: sigma-70 family RNA polymerase sigma factor [bacterium]|nr:sigma-70 family RNA polymerase sigma factor [bacterium]
MSDPADPNVTHLLERLYQGEESVQGALLEALHTDLYSRAQRARQKQPPGHTLQATALLNEAYIRLIGPRDEPWADRTHFLAVAARAMRQILVDHARSKNRAKRSAPGKQVPLDNLLVSYEERAVDIAQLDGALERLAGFDSDMARAVELRFFGGLSVDETAAAVGMSKRTFERKWQATRAWLLAEVR